MVETMTPERLSNLLKDYYGSYSCSNALDMKTKAWKELMQYIGKKLDLSDWIIGDDLMTLTLKQFQKER